ncbi:hypothetical protein HZY91_05640 [Facklamia sp. DSM 111018]|uniref:DUF202 domain-containing protein n=1 Tax=Facklamia lactis TaxID=2749967 RepID=A0ABS0LQD4_9LACT|nr:DUF6442 family protein [Facklamia lactis]MBG9986375.1 hypothetical protein [Facklamia lactis]
MDKKDVLKMAQREKNDEREIFVNDKSSVWISRMLIAIAGFISAIRDSHNLPFFDILAMLCLSIGAGELYKYYIKRENKHLYLFFLLFVIGISATVIFLKDL